MAWTLTSTSSSRRERPPVGTRAIALALRASDLRDRHHLVPLGPAGSRLIFAHLFDNSVPSLLVAGSRQSTSGSSRRSWLIPPALPESVALIRGLKELLPVGGNVLLLFLIGVYGLWNMVAGQMSIFMPGSTDRRDGERRGLETSCGYCCGP